MRAGHLPSKDSECLAEAARELELSLVLVLPGSVFEWSLEPAVCLGQS